MKEREHDISVIELRSNINKHLELLEQAAVQIDAALHEDLPKLGKTARAAVLIAGLIENYYTCAETVFLRISQYFENSLESEKWHRHLLQRMTLEMDTLRPRVLSENVYRDLLELMRFRHFRRYYFGTAYDWDRLEELLKRLERSHQPLIADLTRFLEYLKTLSK